VLSFRNVHHWIEDGRVDATLRAFFAVPEHGGVLDVEEHRTPLTQGIATGYVPKALVIDHAQVTGFQLAGRSEINANPRDIKDHVHGVWSLPPTLRGGEADRTKCLPIGESDRMTLKFIKPAGWDGLAYASQGSSGCVRGLEAFHRTNWREAMQRKASVACTRFLVAQFHESWSRSAAAGVGRQPAYAVLEVAKFGAL
jgi:hypothetical protein